MTQEAISKHLAEKHFMRLKNSGDSAGQREGFLSPLEQWGWLLFLFHSPDGHTLRQDNLFTACTLLCKSFLLGLWEGKSPDCCHMHHRGLPVALSQDRAELRNCSWRFFPFSSLWDLLGLFHADQCGFNCWLLEPLCSQVQKARGAWSVRPQAWLLAQKYVSPAPLP